MSSGRCQLRLCNYPVIGRKAPQSLCTAIKVFIHWCEYVGFLLPRARLWPEWLSDLYTIMWKRKYTILVLHTQSLWLWASASTVYFFSLFQASVSCSIKLFQPSLGGLTVSLIFWVVHIRLNDNKGPGCKTGKIISHLGWTADVFILLQSQWKCLHGIVCFVNEHVCHLLLQLVGFGLTSFHLGLIHHVIYRQTQRIVKWWLVQDITKIPVSI